LDSSLIWSTILIAMESSCMVELSAPIVTEFIGLVPS
jgi:hypothetical protein